MKPNQNKETESAAQGCIAVTILLMLTLCGVLFFFASCEKEEAPPNEPINTGCNCGEITNINQYYPNTFFTYTVKNECTGNDTIVNDAVYHDYGLNMCFNQSW